MRLAAAGSLCALLVLLCPAHVHAQAAVEYGAAAAGATGMGTAASGIGKAISGLVGNLDKTVKSEASPAPSSSERTKTAAKKPAAPRRAVATPKAVDPPKTYEDLKNLEVGLTYADTVRRFGPPSIEIEGASGKSLTYATKEGMTHLEVRDGAIASITRP